MADFTTCRLSPSPMMLSSGPEKNRRLGVRRTSTARPLVGRQSTPASAGPDWSQKEASYPSGIYLARPETARVSCRKTTSGNPFLLRILRKSSLRVSKPRMFQVITRSSPWRRLGSCVEAEADGETVGDSEEEQAEEDLWDLLPRLP